MIHLMQGRRGRGRSKGRGEGSDKDLAEDRVGTLEGRGEGQSL